MGVPRTGFRRSLDSLYDYLDNELPSVAGGRSNAIKWVHSGTGVDATTKGTFDAPYATLDYAIGTCVASRGDVIMIKEGHAETITGAGGIAGDVAGIRIIGLGHNRSRPRFLMDGAATVTFTISANNISVSNCIFAAGHADITKCFDVTAEGFGSYANLFEDNVAGENFLSAINASGTTDNEADYLQAIGNEFLSADAAALAFVLIAADLDQLVIEDNLIVTEGTGLATIFTSLTGKDVTRCSVQRNQLSSKATAGNLGYSNDTASPNNSGIIAENRVGASDVTGAMVLGVVGGCRMFDNLVVSTDALSGFVMPAIDVDS